MRKVFQTRFGAEGNCFSACLASLLEIPIEEIDFIADKDFWLEKTNGFLKPLGFVWVEVDVQKGYPLFPIVDSYCVLTGRSPRNPELNHAVVGRISQHPRENKALFELVHYPMPEGEGLDGPTKFIGFLVPLDPARCLVKGVAA